MRIMNNDEDLFSKTLYKINLYVDTGVKIKYILHCFPQ